MHLFYFSILISKLKSLIKYVLFKFYRNASIEVSGFFVCECIYVYTCIWIHVYMFSCGSQRLTVDVLLHHSHLIFEMYSVSYYFIAVEKHHVKRNLKNKSFNCEHDYVNDYHDRTHAYRQIGIILD